MKLLKIVLIFMVFMIVFGGISFSKKDYIILTKSENVANELIEIYINDMNHFDKINEELSEDEKIAIIANDVLWLKDINMKKESNNKKKKEIKIQLEDLVDLRNEINTRKEKFKSNFFNFIVLFLIAYSSKKIIDYEKNYYEKNFDNKK